MKKFDILIKALAMGLLLILTVANSETCAQVNPLGSVYYQNQYLINPAMGGTEDGLRINLAYRKQWNGIPGAPATGAITADYGFSNKVGLGINLYNEKAGLIRNTKAMATYSYHVALSEERKLHFGLSAGVMNERLDTDGLNGDHDDPQVERFNSQGTYFDGDFGIAYTDSKFTVQAAFPTIVSYFLKDETKLVGRQTFFTAISYKLKFNEGENAVALEPKICLRGSNNLSGILDIGSNVSFLNNQVNIFGLYHSSKNATLGFGVKLKGMFRVTGMYSSESSSMKSYAGGNYEVSLTGTLVKKGK